MISNLKKKVVALALVVVAGVVAMGCPPEPAVEEPVIQEGVIISLPSPRHTGEMSVEEAIFRRRSIRNFPDEPLSLQEVSQLLWSAGGKTIDGVTGATRAFPSAGGLYPFEIYLVAGNVAGLADGIYRFGWRDHSIEMIKEGDFREELMVASLRQGFVYQAPVSIVWVGDFDRVRRAYGARGVDRYIMMDVGGAGQNVHLQAEALGLGTVIVGAFHDDPVQRILGTELMPLYIMPVGRR
ncbi:SagB/ThcOx family dehydrogenase [Dehalococcoidia bacterium]|nr:SagB/ThcOx family dehydrogenase [Dehalococcoidia bacterium]MCL0102472.1 SagB/ThcOx family dehydrogenase [Dehalococcoidia bacterium]